MNRVCFGSPFSILLQSRSASLQQKEAMMNRFEQAVYDCMKPTTKLVERTAKPLHRAMLLNFWRPVHFSGPRQMLERSEGIAIFEPDDVLVPQIVRHGLSESGVERIVVADACASSDLEVDDIDAACFGNAGFFSLESA